MYSVRQLLWKSKIEVKATSTHFKIDEVLVVIVLQLCNCTNAFIKWLCRLVCKLSLQKAWHTSRRTSKYKSTQTLATTKNISINPWRTQTSAKEKLNKKLLSAAKSIYRAQTCNTLSDTCEIVFCFCFCLFVFLLFSFLLCFKCWPKAFIDPRRVILYRTRVRFCWQKRERHLSAKHTRWWIELLHNLT